MYGSFRIALLLATVPMLPPLTALAQMRLVIASSTLEAVISRPDGIVLVGGMTGGGMSGGMSSGGMNGGMNSGGMNGGMSAGGMNWGMTAGGMNGGVIGGIGSGLPGYNASPADGVDRTYGGDSTANGDAQPERRYQCVTQQGHCSVAATPGSLRHGASCGCLLGGPGKIK
jgi:hypothetical protein